MEYKSAFSSGRIARRVRVVWAKARPLHSAEEVQASKLICRLTLLICILATSNSEVSAEVLYFPTPAGDTSLVAWLNNSLQYQLFRDYSVNIEYAGGSGGVVALGCPGQVGYVYWAYPSNPSISGFSCTVNGALSAAMAAQHAYLMNVYWDLPGVSDVEPSFAVLGQFSTYYSGGLQVWEQGILHPYSAARNVDDDPGDDPPACGSEPPSPAFGNPINGATGNKHQVEVDVPRLRSGLLSFVRYYNSAATEIGNLGAGWSSSFTQHLNVFVGRGQTAPFAVNAWRPSGRRVAFSKLSGSWAATPGDRFQLTSTATGWLLRTDENTLENYDDAGRLRGIYGRSGDVYKTSYDAQYHLAGVSDSFGRSISFVYDPNTGLLTSASYSGDPLGSGISYTYQSNAQYLQLSGVTFPDLSTRAYFYENARTPSALTGLQDELGVRFATWTYDDTGRAIGSQHAGGVETWSSTQPDANSLVTTDPLGSARTLTLQGINGSARISAASQPSGSGCSASSSAIGYDANSNVALRDDFNGQRTCYVSDQTRNLENIRVEGLATSQACSAVTISGSALPAGSRKISTQWHPDWRLETLRAEPGRLTSSVYNGQPDPELVPEKRTP